MMATFHIPAPKLQIDFSFALGQMRALYLQEALGATVKEIDFALLNGQLTEFVPEEYLKSLAARGLRGELVFPVPCLLEKNPRLLGYYRLLLGFSQKAFYTTDFGVAGFKAMEESGRLSGSQKTALLELCEALIGSACALVEGIGLDRISRDLLDDLTLLTIGPQLRGGANNKKGLEGIFQVFEIIHEIVKHAATSSSASKIELENAAGRQVLIAFASDPDIVIQEAMAKLRYRNVVAIEVKGGTDFSNIHNRLGEAEKSHQKAKASEYVECWTVVNVDRIDLDMARRESPSTNRFYRLSALMNPESDEYQDFRNRIISLTGIRCPEPE
jgi:hypothetical protein